MSPNVYFPRFGQPPTTVHRGGVTGNRWYPACRDNESAGRYITMNWPVTCEECLRLP